VINTSYKTRVAVLRGGPSSEYDVSMQTGAGILSALRDLSVVAKDIIISRKGEWLVNGYVKTPIQALADVDAVFVALHGAYGEDGKVQRELERLSIPFTGSRSFASAVAMNKVLTKDYLKKHGSSIQMAPHIRLTKEGVSNLAQTVFNISEVFGPEYVIKPLNGGSSIGAKIVSKPDLLREVAESFDSYDEIIIEKRIVGKEATVGIVENFRGERYYQLPAIEIIPPANTPLFSTKAKYNKEADEICPGRFSKEEKKQLGEIAQAVHQALGLRQYSRSDFIVAEDGIYFLEVNTLPSITSESLFQKSMEAVGGSHKELIAHLLATV